jgi:hypothetical protein
VAGIAVAAAACSPVAAQAATTPAGANVILTFGNPQLAPDGTTVTWNWRVTNASKERADQVIVVNEFTPAGKIKAISDRCESAVQGKIVCDYGTLAPGGVLTGWVRTPTPATVESVHIGGQVTWVDSQFIPKTSQAAGAGQKTVAKAATHDQTHTTVG